MRHTLLITLAALSCILTFSACSSDDDPEAKRSGIVGEWILVYNYNQGVGEYLLTVIEYTITTCNANNTGTSTIYRVTYKDFDSGNPKFNDIYKNTGDFKYNIKDNQITLDDGSTDVDPMTLNFAVSQDGNQLTMGRNGQTTTYGKVDNDWQQEIDQLEKVWQLSQDLVIIDDPDPSLYESR